MFNYLTMLTFPVATSKMAEEIYLIANVGAFKYCVGHSGGLEVKKLENHFSR